MKVFIVLVFSIALCCILSSTNGSETYRCRSNVAKTKYLKTHGNHCYQFNNFERRWTDAQRYCSIYSGHLVVIKSQAVQNFIMSSLKSLNWKRNGVWIGANDRQREMHWKWVTGEAITYNNWASGQPSCGFFCVEDCGQLRYSDNGRWHDYPCSSIPYLYSFICQYDMLPPTTTTTTTTTPTPTTNATTIIPNKAVEEKIEIVHTDLLKNKAGSSLNKVLNKTSAVLTTTIKSSEQSESKYTLLVNEPGQQRLEKSKDGSMPTGITIALALGTIFGLMVGICGAVCFVRRRRKKPQDDVSLSSGYANPYYGEVPTQIPFSDDEEAGEVKIETVLRVIPEEYDVLPSLSLNNPTYGKVMDAQYDLPKPSSSDSSSDTYQNSNPACENIYEDIDHIKSVIAMNESRDKQEEEDRYVAMPTKGACAP